VLIIDDHAPFRAAARELLERRGFTVVGEADGAKAGLEAAEAVAPEAVVLDVQLPDGNGIDVCKALTEANPTLAVLLVSADEHHDRSADDCGAVAGQREVRECRRLRPPGHITGSYVQSGVITRGSKVRFLRDGTIIWKGSVTSLKRFKDDATEVRAGFECGIGLSDFQDLKPGDIIETYEEQEIART